MEYNVVSNRKPTQCAYFNQHIQTTRAEWQLNTGDQAEQGEEACLQTSNRPGTNRTIKAQNGSFVLTLVHENAERASGTGSKEANSRCGQETP